MSTTINAIPTTPDNIKKFALLSLFFSAWALSSKSFRSILPVDVDFPAY